MGITNITYVLSNPDCNAGLGCLLKNINYLGNGYPFMVLFILTYVISTFALIKAKNHFIKSFTASTFLMMFFTVISFLYELINEQWVLIIISILAILTAVNIYLMRRY